MFTEVFILIMFTGLMCGLFLLGGLIDWSIEKFKEYKSNREYKGCTFSSSFMTDEEVAEWMKSLRK